MRLVNYGAGEMSDRLTILSLKILHGEMTGKEVKHFTNEREALLAQIRSRTLNGSWLDQLLALGAVNAALWYAEDALRTARQQHVELVADPKELVQLVEAVRIAFCIQDLNDRRAALIETVNKQTGEHLGSEKLL